MSLVFPKHSSPQKIILYNMIGDSPKTVLYSQYLQRAISRLRHNVLAYLFNPVDICMQFPEEVLVSAGRAIETFFGRGKVKKRSVSLEFGIR